ncbi:NAD-dependent epimerase/dehydratase family protein [bacterium]|nr:NAD-dependent epimerase/dehydratase family protein [bacterium]
MEKIMITGALGQIGSELVSVLREKYGGKNILATDIKSPSQSTSSLSVPFEYLDVTHKDSIENIVKKYRIDTIYHMSAILSATGEKNPHQAWDVNINGTYNILEVARQEEMTRVFVPSSIAVFSPETPRNHTPQDTVLKPRTMYGITKVTGELLSEYYVCRFGLDVRGCRYPGIISHQTLPGGGTTDYAVEIFYEAVKNKHYTCFVRKDTRLPMMYMPDCLKAAVDLMETDFSRLKHHAGFNVNAMSFSAEELAVEIKKHIPDFVCEYKPDERQNFADTWPNTIDDSAARREWGWKPRYNLSSMAEDMVKVLSQRHQEGKLNY